jgi:hypothetical protein
MPSKRDVLALVTRDELLAIVDQCDLALPERRVKGTTSKNRAVEEGDGPWDAS